MMTFLIGTSAIQAAAICGMFLWLLRMQRSNREHYQRAIEFALSKRVWEGRAFLRAFIFNNQTEIRQSFPEWEGFRVRQFNGDL